MDSKISVFEDIKTITKQLKQDLPGSWLFFKGLVCLFISSVTVQDIFPGFISIFHDCHWLFAKFYSFSRFSRCTLIIPGFRGCVEPRLLSSQWWFLPLSNGSDNLMQVLKETWSWRIVIQAIKYWKKLFTRQYSGRRNHVLHPLLLMKVFSGRSRISQMKETSTPKCTDCANLFSQFFFWKRRRSANSSNNNVHRRKLHGFTSQTNIHARTHMHAYALTHTHACTLARTHAHVHTLYHHENELSKRLVFHRWSYIWGSLTLRKGSSNFLLPT